MLPLSQRVMKQCIINQSKSVAPGWKTANRTLNFSADGKRYWEGLSLGYNECFLPRFGVHYFFLVLGTGSLFQLTQIFVRHILSEPQGFWKKTGFKKPGIQSSCVIYYPCLLCSGQRALCQCAVLTTRGHFDTCFWLYSSSASRIANIRTCCVHTWVVFPSSSNEMLSLSKITVCVILNKY